MLHDHDVLPPPPNISHPGIMTRDVTAKFADAVKKLQPGDIIKDDHFTLFEAVSALEIMDPKMDSGFLQDGESLDEEYNVSRDLLPEEILGIIDQLLCLEMAWHLGYPLSQTLLISVYVDALLKPRPSNIEEADFVRDPSQRGAQPRYLFILRAYCIGLLKACSMVNDAIKEELYYEEEDFVTNTYDRSLLSDIPLGQIFGLLQQARGDLRSISSIELPSKLGVALDMRLELRISFLRAMDLMGLQRTNPDSLKMPWLQMKGVIDNIRDQHSLGKPVPEAFSTKLQRSLASTMPPRPIVQLSFEETYQHLKRLFQDGHDITDVLKYSDPQSLLTFVTTFQARKPQPLVLIRSLMQALLFKDMIVLGSYSVRQILDHDLSIVVLPCGGQIDRTNDDIEVPTDPRHQTASQMEIFRQRVAEAYFDLFRIFCQSRCRLRRTLCHSIREWDMLQTDVEEIDQLLQINLEERPLISAERGGEVGYSLPLSSWAYLYKLRQMEWIVQLGFELDIYQPEELAGMYWYLNYLAKTRAQHGDRIKAFTMQALNQARGSAQSSSGASSSANSTPPAAASTGKATYTAAKEREFMRSLSFLRAIMLDAACTWEFADGLCCLYTVMMRYGLSPVSSTPRRKHQYYRPGRQTPKDHEDHETKGTADQNLSTPAASDSQQTTGTERAEKAADAHRYEVRMRPFAGVSLPPLPTHDEAWRATTQPDTPVPDLLAYAAGAVGGAIKGYEALTRLSDVQAFAAGGGTATHTRWLAGVNASLRAATAAAEAIEFLSSICGCGGGAKKDPGAQSPASSMAIAPVAQETEDQETATRKAETSHYSDEDAAARVHKLARVHIPGPDERPHDWWIVPIFTLSGEAETDGEANRI